MRVLSIHNHYRHRGGEDAVFDDEARLLEDNGHIVVRYTATNEDASRLNPLRLAGRTVWSAQSHRDLGRLIDLERPDVVHVHNWLSMISPSAYYAARSQGVPVVQTLHNYRLMCPGVVFEREGKVCEDCLGRRFAWPAVRHACYRNSRGASATVAVTLTAHRIAGTWDRQVDRYIAPTEFLRDKYIEGGLPPESIVVKPHFVADGSEHTGVGTGSGGFCLFVGRLAEEKGVRSLLAAWEQVAPGARLLLVGDGPLADVVDAASRRLPGVDWLGKLPPHDVRRLMGEASFVVVPSVGLEAFGLVFIEAFSAGTPVLASSIGPAIDLVDDGRTGRHFPAGDADDLAAQIGWFLDHPDDVASMRVEARAEYESKYTADRNLELLLDIYDQVIREAKS